jgi:creatinine amidohydrolase
MVAPTLAYGMSQHHLGFVGSATLRPSTLMLVVRDVVESLATHGFERFFFINGHGGNVATVTAAFDELYAARSLGAATAKVRCRMTFWSAGKRGQALAEELYPGVNGHHATASEVALAQYYQQSAIKHAQMTPKVAPTAPQFFEAADYRARFPDGRIGSDPSLSTPEHGKRLYDAAVADMVEAYQTFLAY